MTEKNKKKEQAKKINEIQQKVMDVYFELEDFKQYDIAMASLTKSLDLMDAVSAIRTKILKDENGQGSDHN